MSYPTAAGIRGRCLYPYKSRVSGFSPSDISGLSLWLDADAEYLLTEPSARDFESGNTEFFSVAAPATDYDLGTTDFGIALNVNRETAGTQQVICGKYLDSSNYWMFYINASNLLRFYCLVGGSEVADITGTTALSSTSVYYHLAVVLDRDSAANTKLYVDGADDTSGTPTISATDCTLNTAFEVGRTSTAFVPIGNLSFSVQTVGTNDTFDLIHPLTNATVHSFDVDWGDGNVDTVTSKTDPNLTHTYADEGEYTINLTGSLDSFAFANGGDKTMVTAVNNVAGDTLGLANAAGMFFGCSNLTTIASGCFDDCASFAANAFNETFRGCSSLISIPEGLFDNCVAAEGFVQAFYECTTLVSIPVDMFRYTAGTTFTSVFLGCTGLTSIPADLFRYNTSATALNYVFYGCTSVTEVPVDLFRYNTSATTFIFAFYGCTSLTTVPADIFLYNTACTDFTDVFFNCALTETSVDNFLVSLDDAGQSNGTADCDGGTSSAPSATGDAAVTSLQGKGWTVTTN